MDFSFGVLTYNSADTVLDTLFSIKYQVTQHMADCKVEIVISDDHSSDNTLLVVKEWIKEFSSLFESAKVIESKINTGTVKNYNRLFDSLQSERFHIISGDDIYSSGSILDAFNNLDKKECNVGFPLSLKGNVLDFEKNRLARHIYMYTRSRDVLKCIMLGSYVHTPSVVFFKSLYDTSIRDYVSQFRLFEDDPRWYSFAKRNIKFRFNFNTIVIYRYKDSSVSHGRKRSYFDIDLFHLNKNYLRENVLSLKMRFFLMSKLKYIKSKNKYSVYILSRFADSMILKTLSFIKSDWTMRSSLLKSILDANKKYYEILLAEKNNYLNK